MLFYITSLCLYFYPSTWTTGSNNGLSLLYIPGLQIIMNVIDIGHFITILQVNTFFISMEPPTVWVLTKTPASVRGSADFPSSKNLNPEEWYKDAERLKKLLIAEFSNEVYNQNDQNHMTKLIQCYFFCCLQFLLHIHLLSLIFFKFLTILWST